MRSTKHHKKLLKGFSFFSTKKWLWFSVFMMSGFSFASYIHYTVRFANTNEIGWEAVVIRIFSFYSIFRPGLIRRFLFQASQTKLWFILIYLPYILYSLWFAFWGITHQWPIAIFYPIIFISCFIFSWNMFQSLEK